MNATIWIHDPFIFKSDEHQALEKAIWGVYGGNPVYLRKWQGDVAIDQIQVINVTITTCKQIVRALETIHLMHAILDKKYRGRLSNYCQDLKICIQKPGEDRPSWAEENHE